MGSEDTINSSRVRDALDKIDNVLGVAELAKMLGYSEKRIRDFLKEGRIKGERVEPRGKWMVPISEVNRFRGELTSSTKGQLEQKQQSEADAANKAGETRTISGDDPLILEARRQHFHDLQEVGRVFTESLNKFLSWALPAIDVMQGKTTEEEPEFPVSGYIGQDWERCKSNPLFECFKSHVPDNNLWQSHENLCNLWDRYGDMESLIIDSLSGQDKRNETKEEFERMNPYDACEELLPQMPPIIREIQDSVTIAISRGVFEGTCPACPFDYRTKSAD